MEMQLPSSPSRGKSPLAFFLLAIALGMIYFLLAASRVLPVAVLNYFGAFIPAVTALILVYRQDRTKGVVELLGRSFDFKRTEARAWFLPVFLLWPFIVSIQYGLALLSGVPVASPNFSLWSPIGLAFSFVLALGEEMGWMGYAYEPMQERLGALRASVVLGIIWASIHIPYFASSGASSWWIVWQFVYVAAIRVLFVWVYNNAGRSLFAVAILHTLFNQVWLLFPRDQSLVGMSVPSFYSPLNLALTTIVLAAIITFFWGSKTLAEFWYTQRGQPRSSAP